MALDRALRHGAAPPEPDYLAAGSDMNVLPPIAGLTGELSSRGEAVDEEELTAIVEAARAQLAGQVLTATAYQACYDGEADVPALLVPYQEMSACFYAAAQPEAGRARSTSAVRPGHREHT